MVPLFDTEAFVPAAPVVVVPTVTDAVIFPKSTVVLISVSFLVWLYDYIGHLKMSVFSYFKFGLNGVAGLTLGVNG